MLLTEKYRVFLFVYIKKHVNKEIAFAAYLAQVSQFTSENVFEKEKKKLCRKTVKI